MLTAGNQTKTANQRLDSTAGKTFSPVAYTNIEKSKVLPLPFGRNEVVASAAHYLANSRGRLTDSQAAG